MTVGLGRLLFFYLTGFEGRAVEKIDNSVLLVYHYIVTNENIQRLTNMKCKIKKTIIIILAFLAVVWLILYCLSSAIYQHEDLYNHTGNNFINFGYSRYNSQGVEDAWNFSKEINGHKLYIENICCCYIADDTAYLVSTNKEYVVLDISSGEYTLYNGSENITSEEHLKTFQYISRMHIVRGVLFGQ